MSVSSIDFMCWSAVHATWVYESALSNAWSINRRSLVLVAWEDLCKSITHLQFSVKTWFGCIGWIHSWIIMFWNRGIFVERETHYLTLFDLIVALNIIRTTSLVEISSWSVFFLASLIVTSLIYSLVSLIRSTLGTIL